LIKSCDIAAYLPNSNGCTDLYISHCSDNNIILNRYSTTAFTYNGTLNPGRYRLHIKYSSDGSRQFVLLFYSVNNYNYQGTFNPYHFIFNVSSSL